MAEKGQNPTLPTSHANQLYLRRGVGAKECRPVPLLNQLASTSSKDTDRDVCLASEINMIRCPNFATADDDCCALSRSASVRVRPSLQYLLYLRHPKPELLQTSRKFDYYDKLF